MGINWKTIEKAEQRWLENEQYSPDMQKLLKGINRIRSENGKMNRAISFFEKLSESEEIQILYFGGFLRDAYLGFMPRDLDLVVENGWERFQHTVQPFLKRKNRFGGLKLDVYGVETDVWEVSSTDAFKRGVTCPASINHLPETTVFNCESIVLEIWAPEKRYWGWEQGFFDGCKTKTLEIQNPWNHDFQEEYAALQLARVSKLHSKLGWKLGPSLKSYVKRQLDRVSPADIQRFYESHYGERCSAQKIIKDLKALL